jgi:hypothetical protein
MKAKRSVLGLVVAALLLGFVLADGGMTTDPDGGFVRFPTGGIFSLK